MMKFKIYSFMGLVLMILCFGSFMNFTYAAQTVRKDMVFPFWQELTLIKTSLIAEGKQLECECAILANEMDCPIVGTMSLEKKINGRWQRVIAWGIKDKGSAELIRRYKGTSATEYRLKIYVQVGQEKIIEYSDTCTVE